MVRGSNLYTSELDIYSPTIGPPRTDYRQAEQIHKEMLEELFREEKIRRQENKNESKTCRDDSDYGGLFPYIEYKYTVCEVAFLLHKLNQLAKRKRIQNLKRKEICSTPEESMESFCVDFARVSALNMISTKFLEAMKNSLEVQAKERFQ